VIRTALEHIGLALTGRAGSRLRTSSRRTRYPRRPRGKSVPQPHGRLCACRRPEPLPHRMPGPASPVLHRACWSSFVCLLNWLGNGLAVAGPVQVVRTVMAPCLRQGPYRDTPPPVRRQQAPPRTDGRQVYTQGTTGRLSHGSDHGPGRHPIILHSCRRSDVGPGGRAPPGRWS
jgi:hypothetical protein